MEKDDIAARLAALSPTKRALLERRLAQSGYSGVPVLMIPRRDATSAPLSFAQQRLWFLSQLEPDSTAYNEITMLRLDGELNIDALKHALNTVVERHESLRTTYTVGANGEAVQTIGPAQPLELLYVDLDAVPVHEQNEKVQREALALRSRVFDLKQDAPLRAALLRLAAQRHVLIVIKHHIASDGWSTSVFLRELAAHYARFLQPVLEPLPPLPIQYADYAVWQRTTLQGEPLERQLGYWRKQLDGLSVLQLPSDWPRPAIQSYDGARESAIMPQDLVTRLKMLGSQHGVTLFMTLLAAFQLLLHRYTSQDDIAVGSPIAGRTRPELEDLIGFFVNTLVLRTDFSGNPTFLELLERVRSVALNAYDHQDLPFEKLVEELKPARERSQTPLFQVMFAVQNVPRSALELPGVTISQIELDSAPAKFDVFVAFHERDGQLTVRVEYRTELFERATIRRMIEHCRVLLESIAANPQAPINDLTILTETEQRQLLNEWNTTATDYPRDRSIQQIFEAQAAQLPKAVALVMADQTMTYSELNRRANQVARYLRRLGLAPQARVAIAMERSFEFAISVLATLKAGAVYVPLDPNYPAERLAFILEDTQAAVLLTKEKFLPSLMGDSNSDGAAPIVQNPKPVFSTCSGHALSLVDGSKTQTPRVVAFDREWSKIEKEIDQNLLCEVSSADLAYVMYTSGSTGTPKGVEISHGAIARLVFGGGYVQLDGTERIAQLAPIAFDASTFEIWGALLHGARSVIFPATLPAPGELGDWLHRHAISTLWLTASLFNTVIELAPEALSGVKQLLIGGEALSIAHVRRALELLPETHIINGYGPTESTTFACCYPIPRTLPQNITSVPIGKPIGNTTAYILDGAMHPVPIGIAGELYIGGAGLARGYVNDPVLTKMKFIGNPFYRGERLYRTGDLARYRSDGHIEFLGRSDDQIKIRGYRIEPGEIECTLAQHPAVRACAVIARREPSLNIETTKPDNRLIAFFSSAETTPATTDLRSFLERRLPAYMIPADFVRLDALPLTPTGKVDRQALTALSPARTEEKIVYAAPRTPTERAIAPLWSEALGIERIGIHENFFALGGHSLLVVRLFDRIAKFCGRSIPVSAIFRAPTIAQLAELIDGAERVARSTAVPIQIGDASAPFFCVHGAWGSIVFCAELARRMGADQPFYGLQAAGLEGEQEPLTRIEDMAAHHIRMIRQVQPQGPYFLGGLSLGGLVAFEIAQQLFAQGERVALLALIDTHRPMHKGIAYDWRRRARRLIVEDIFARCVFHGRNLLQGSASSYAREKTRALGKKLTRRLRLDHQAIQVHLRDSYAIKVRKANLEAMQAYVPRSYPGPITLLVTSDSANQFDTPKGWRALAAGGLAVHPVPGDHTTMLSESHVGALAAKLRECVDKAKIV